MSDKLRISRTWPQRFEEHKIVVPALLRRAGLPPGLFQPEKVYVTTAELFALWRAVGEMSSDPGIGMKLGAETRLERSHPAAIAVMCSRTFADALERLGRYKKLTCPEEIRVRTTRDEASVEFFYLQTEEVQPDLLVDLCLSWILSIGRRGTDGQVTPLRLELTRPVQHRELLETLVALELVENVAPIQLAMRLLIPAGSRLLDLAEVRQMVRPFDPAALSYPWRHDDPALDRLCSEIQSLIQREERRKASRREIFAGIWSLAHDRPVPVDFHLAARATIPYLDEPWYC